MRRDGKFIFVIWSYVVSAIAIISTGGAWLSDTAIDFNKNQLSELLLAILIISFFILVLFNHSPCINKLTGMKISIVIICMANYQIVCQSNVDSYNKFFAFTIIWLIACMSLLEDKRRIWISFTNIAVVIAVISLFFYICGSLLNLVHETGVTELNWGTWDTSSVRTFFNVYYEAQTIKINDTQRIFRNCGIFSEAPMYNMILCTALSAELFLTKKVNRIKCAILVFAIVTTLSTTGFLFLILAGLFLWANCIFKTKRLTIHKIAFGVVSLIGFLTMILMVVQKMFSNSGRGSMNVRTDHLLACIKTWFKYPIYGCGFLNQESVLVESNYEQGLSVGFPYLLACGGVLLIGVIVVPYLLNFIRAVRIKYYKEICFETLFMILYFFTAITGRSILCFFIAYIVVCNDCDLKVIEENEEEKKYEKREYDIRNFGAYLLKRIKLIVLSGVLLGVAAAVILLLKDVNTLLMFLITILSGFIGILLMVFICYILFICKNVFFSSEEFCDMFGIDILGRVSVYEERTFHGIKLLNTDDKCILDLENEEYKKIVQNLRKCKKGGEIILLTGMVEMKVLQDVSKKLIEAMPEIQIVIGDNLNMSVSTLHLLEDCDSVVLVEREEYSKCYEIMQEKRTVNFFEKNILGAIICFKS